jgi:hypothetical protein
MKQLFFNDLSISPLAKDFSDAWLRIQKFIITYKSRPEDIFENRICSECYLGSIQLAPDLNLQDFCNNPKGRTLGSLLLGLTKHPYIDAGSIQEDNYLESDFSILKNSNAVPAFGLAAAYLHDSIGIGFSSEPFWDNVLFTLIENNNESINSLFVLSVSCPMHYQSEAFLQWYDNHTEIKLIESDFSPDEKNIHLRSDHGFDVLHAFSKKLIRSPYVIAIVNSLPFNPRETEFIKSSGKDGLVELVLTTTDQGFGLVVKTTGRNLRETNLIASILRGEFES